jgi:hypothetical protein
MYSALRKVLFPVLSCGKVSGSASLGRGKWFRGGCSFRELYGFMSASPRESCTGLNNEPANILTEHVLLKIKRTQAQLGIFSVGCSYIQVLSVYAKWYF